jgi:hypothetical protein
MSAIGRLPATPAFVPIRPKVVPMCPKVVSIGTSQSIPTLSQSSQACHLFRSCSEPAWSEVEWSEAVSAQNTHELLSVWNRGDQKRRRTSGQDAQDLPGEISNYQEPNTTLGHFASSQNRLLSSRKIYEKIKNNYSPQTGFIYIVSSRLSFQQAKFPAG